MIERQVHFYRIWKSIKKRTNKRHKTKEVHVNVASKFAEKVDQIQSVISKCK